MDTETNNPEAPKEPTKLEAIKAHIEQVRQQFFQMQAQHSQLGVSLFQKKAQLDRMTREVEGEQARYDTLSQTLADLGLRLDEATAVLSNV